ncbi:DUF1223 domain-containing protein [Sedimenticola sp.]|uniref:DUF1223 domain-containing protein n=1 Tax=Sedimenticola sp. TaxID=1940285 RepID=UPI003D0D040C
MATGKRLIKSGLGVLLATLVSGNLLADTVRIESGDRRVNLVELYTSEGCSSCPPAEAWLNGFIKDEGLWQQVIPLAFHVDYWDYIGWQDRYAQPRFSDRQYRYQREGGIRTVYTPGVLVNGEEWRRWFRQRPALANETVGALSLEVADNRVKARFEPVKKPAGGLRLHLAVVAFGLESDVAAGENRGRDLRHDFVVVGLNASDSTDLQWQSPLPEIKQTDAKRLALVAWVSEPERQAPLQAAGGWLPTSE